MTLSDEQLMDKLLAQSPDELLLYIRLYRSRPKVPGVIDMLTTAYELVCKQRLADALGVKKEDRD
jgi:hypothetical protein